MHTNVQILYLISYIYREQRQFRIKEVLFCWQAFIFDFLGENRKVHIIVHSEPKQEAKIKPFLQEMESCTCFDGYLNFV